MSALTNIQQAITLLQQAESELAPPVAPVVPSLSAYSKVKWKQDYTKMNLLDTSVYDLCDGWLGQQGVTTQAKNLKLDADNGLTIMHPEQGYSAKLYTLQNLFAVGEVLESEIWVPANAQGLLYNWPTAWTGQAANWPADGEHDYLEAQNGGKATVNYHGPNLPDDASNDPTGGQVGFGNCWLKATLFRQSKNISSVWWTKPGQTSYRARIYATTDSGNPESVVFSDGEQPGSIPMFDPSGEVAFKIKNVTIYTKP